LPLQRFAHNHPHDAARQRRLALAGTALRLAKAWPINISMTHCRSCR
jgi:hypothetical protein